MYLDMLGYFLRKLEAALPISVQFPISFYHPFHQVKDLCYNILTSKSFKMFTEINTAKQSDFPPSYSTSYI